MPNVRRDRIFMLRVLGGPVVAGPRHSGPTIFPDFLGPDDWLFPTYSVEKLRVYAGAKNLGRYGATRSRSAEGLPPNGNLLA
jgi:hypothetical protein